MGVFLLIAVFFNNPTLLNFSNTTETSTSINTECGSPTTIQICSGNLSKLNPTDIGIINDSSIQIICHNTFSQLNCTSNLSSDQQKPQTQKSQNLAKFFSFLSTVLFLVIACVVLFDSLSYVRIYTHSRRDDKKKATIGVIKDLTIFLFIIPFTFLLIFFVNLSTAAFGEFLATGVLIFLITVYIAEIFVVMYLFLRALNSYKGNRTKELQLGILCFILGLLSLVVFWFIFPETINFTLSISLALLLMSLIAFLRPHIERYEVVEHR